MKNYVLLCLFAAGSLALLGGCSSRYVIVTNDYAIHVTSSKPEVEGDTGTISFKDESGQKVMIPRKDMKEIKEIK